MGVLCMSFVHFPELFSLFPFPFFSCGLAQMGCTMYPNSTGFLLYIWYVFCGCEEHYKDGIRLIL